MGQWTVAKMGNGLPEQTVVFWWQRENPIIITIATGQTLNNLTLFDDDDK